MKPRNQLGNQIRLLRLKKGIKQEELSKAIGVSQTKLSKIENCHKEITEKELNNLCILINVTRQEIQDFSPLTTTDILSLFETIKKENHELKLIMTDIYSTLKVLLTQKNN
jgi:transcriptional regulator with XRE-family HTH domain